MMTMALIRLLQVSNEAPQNVLTILLIHCQEEKASQQMPSMIQPEWVIVRLTSHARHIRRPEDGDDASFCLMLDIFAAECPSG